MTTKDLRAIDGFTEMCGSEPFRKLIAFSQENCPFVGKDIADPTGIVRNEGRLQGWFQLLQFLRSVHRGEETPTEEAPPRRLYADPDAIKSDLNKPKS